MLYRRTQNGKKSPIWWYKFKFGGRVFRESTKTTSKALAREAERRRHRQLEEGYNGLTKRQRPVVFSVAADEWLEVKKGTLAAKSYGVEVNCLRHLRPYFGQRLVSDIDASAIARYVGHRRAESAADKSIKLEIGTLRGILKRAKLWAAIKEGDDLIPKLADRDDIGRALEEGEEAACSKSKSRGLYTAVALALNTGLREGEIRLLRWRQIDFEARTVTVGKAKTSAGSGRVVPLNDRATLVLRAWGNKFPDPAPDHFVFPAEQYGRPGENSDKPGRYATDLKKPIGSWKTAWETARREAKVKCRFHDLRHTVCTRMLEAGVPFSVVAAILGWSPGTTVRMAKRYGHIGQKALRQAVNVLDRAQTEHKSTDRVAARTA